MHILRTVIIQNMFILKLFGGLRCILGGSTSHLTRELETLNHTLKIICLMQFFYKVLVQRVREGEKWGAVRRYYS